MESWAEAPAGAKAQGLESSVFDVATKRMPGLRWMGERRLGLIWAMRGQLAPTWTPGCLPTQTSPQPLGFSQEKGRQSRKGSLQITFS